MAVRNRILFSALAAAAAFAAPGASAQADPLAELDALVDASARPDTGEALARTQIGKGELTAALGTIERVLMNDPGADPALLLHVTLLCRLDDLPGARAEVAEMRDVPMSDPGWAEVTAACGPMPRPGARGEP